MTQACASTPSPPPSSARPVRVAAVLRADRLLLLNPVENYPLGLDVGRQTELVTAYRRLIAGSSPQEVAATARRLLAVDPELAPALVLAAQADLVAGKLEAAARRLRPLIQETPDYTAAVLTLALAQEGLGRLVEACEGYLASQRMNEEAARRATRLLPRAIEAVSLGFADEMERGRFDQAERSLARLELWAPGEDFSLEGRRALSVATGDATGELLAIRRLTQRGSDHLDLIRRHGELELQVGDSTTGLQIFQSLAAEFPDDPTLAESLAVARFRWRLQLLPEEVRALVDLQPELDRSQFASLLYWLVPEVRYGRPRRARIANDIFDHSNREEISRVVNLGLMGVDATLHHFAPARAVTLGEALRSLLITLADGEPPPACLAGRRFDRRSSAQALCAAAVRCLLLTDRAECLLQGPVSGPEAVEMVRRTLHQQ